MDIDKKLSDIKDCLYRVAVKAIIVQDSKLLIVKDASDEGWSLPGGGVDYGEDLGQALIRELNEEISIVANNIKTDYKVVGTLIGHKNNGIPRCNLHFIVDIGDVTIEKASELDDLDWVSLNQIDGVKFDQSAGNIAGLIHTLMDSNILSQSTLS